MITFFVIDFSNVNVLSSDSADDPDEGQAAPAPRQKPGARAAASKAQNFKQVKISHV